MHFRNQLLKLTQFGTRKVSLLLILISLVSIHFDTYSQSITIQGKVVDGNSGEAMPYVAVFTKADRRGTISDVNGFFELTNLSNQDTIVFFFTGYEKRFLATSEIQEVIQLFPLEQLFDDVIVLADKSVLYEMISNTRKSRPKETIVAKTYFEVETFLDTTQTELFQGYFNGNYHGYDTRNLTMKTARFGLNKTDQQAFLSMDISRAMYAHTLFENDGLFPTSPFELNRRKLMKNYQLELNNKYRQEDSSVTYVISFFPREDSLRSFSGRVWIDSASNYIDKLELLIENASVHPFSPLHEGGQLQNVNLEITKSFDKSSGIPRLSSMDFNYDFTFDPKAVYNPETGIVFKNPTDSLAEYLRVEPFNVKSAAILVAFDYGQSFFIPTFDFISDNLSDYNKMNAFQFHRKFWACYNAFKVPNNDSKESFLKDHAIVSNDRLFQSNEISENGFFEFPYKPWSEKRIYFRPRNGEKDETERYVNPAVNQYHLEAQILFEIDSLCDSVQFRTITIFDPYKSYYDLEQTPQSVAFLNMYFDLMEIYRRQLEVKLMATPTEKWREVYKNHIEYVHLETDRFFKEVDRGTNTENFVKWNAFVRNELKIDNVGLFVPAED